MRLFEFVLFIFELVKCHSLTNVSSKLGDRNDKIKTETFV